MAASTHGDGAIRAWQKVVSHVPGAEYFKGLKRPRDVNHLDYFRYCRARCSKKDEWHRTWLEVVLPSFKSSGIPILEQEHNRLSKEWGKRMDETTAFWTELETKELKEQEELVEKRRMVHLKEQVAEQINMTVDDYTQKTRSTLEHEQEQRQKTSTEPPQTSSKVSKNGATLTSGADAYESVPQLGRSHSAERALQEEAPSRVLEDTATSDHIKILNQRDKWILHNVDLVKKFKTFAAGQTHSYSLARDGIADLTSRGEFVACLSQEIFNDIVDQCPSLEPDRKVNSVLDAVFPLVGTKFESALINADSLDKSDSTVKHITSTLDSYSLFYPAHNAVPPMHERQHFAEVAIPAFRRAFRFIGKDISLFEVKILGCARRKNMHRIPMIDKVNHAHQADGIVWHDHLQVVLFECSPPQEKDVDKAFADLYKLSRDLKDTWVYNIEQLISSGRQPPQDLKVFGVQIDTRFVKIYALDFVGCFRLQEMATMELPVQLATFQTKFRSIIRAAFSFAHMVQDEVQRWDIAMTLEQAQIRKAELALRQLPPTNITPTRIKKAKKSHLQNADDED